MAAVSFCDINVIPLVHKLWGKLLISIRKLLKWVCLGFFSVEYRIVSMILVCSMMHYDWYKKIKRSGLMKGTLYHTVLNRVIEFSSLWLSCYWTLLKDTSLSLKRMIKVRFSDWKVKSKLCKKVTRITEMPLETLFGTKLLNKFRHYIKGLGFFSETWDGEAVVIFSTMNERGGGRASLCNWATVFS